MAEPASTKQNGTEWRLARIGASIVIVVLIAIYAESIVSGNLRKERQIDGPGLAVIVVGAVFVVMVLEPRFLERLSRLELAGFKLELLKRVQEKQSQQEIQLNDMQLLLPLLLPAAERRHLRNLIEKKTSNYKGNHNVRSELRHMRTLDLIEMCGDHHVGELKDDMPFDLGKYVKLKEFGQMWAERIQKIKEPDSGEDVADGRAESKD